MEGTLSNNIVEQVMVPVCTHWNVNRLFPLFFFFFFLHSKTFKLFVYPIFLGGRNGRDRMVVGFTTTCEISAYHT